MIPNPSQNDHVLRRDPALAARLRRYLVDYLTAENVKNIIADMGVRNIHLPTNNSPADNIRDILGRLKVLPESTYHLFLQQTAANRPDLDLSPFGGPIPSAVIPSSTPSPPGNRPMKTESKQYENFDITVEAVGEKRYRVSARYTFGGGAGSGPVTRPLDVKADAFNNLYIFLQELVAEKSDAKELGRMMYEFLFPNQVQSLFIGLRSRLQSGKQGIRIRLRIEPPELRSLPWEYCYDPVNNTFLSKDLDTPIVRYIERSYTPETLTADGPLKILLVLSNPTNLPPLQVEEEEKRVRAALEPLGDRVQLQVLGENVTGYQLQQVLSRFKPDVFHYVGHGQFVNGEGALLIQNDEGKSRTLNADQLADLVRNRGVKMVVLNACDTAKADEEGPAFMSVAPGLVFARIPAVIAMQFKVPDEIALRYTQALYDQLAQGNALDTAVTEMRIAASVMDMPESEVLWGIPTLFMRAPDGRIWQNQNQPARTTATAGTAYSSETNMENNMTNQTDNSTDNSTTNTGAGGNSGGTNFNFGGNVSVGGDLVGGDKVGGDSIKADGDVTINKTSTVHNAGGEGESKEPTLADLIEQIRQDVRPYAADLDKTDAEDVESNIADAAKSAQAAAPKGKRIARKLDNVIDILEDAEVGADDLIDQIEKVIKLAKKAA